MRLIENPDGFYFLDNIPQENIQSLIDICTKYVSVEFCVLTKTARQDDKIIEYHTDRGQEVVLDPLDRFNPTKVNTAIISSPTDVENYLPPSQFYTLFFTKISRELISYLSVQFSNNRIFLWRRKQYKKGAEKNLKEVLGKRQIPQDGGQKPGPTNGLFLRRW